MWAANQFKGKGFPSLLWLGKLRGTIYHIWRERNARLYKTEYKCKEEVLKAIKDDVRFRCASILSIRDDPTTFIGVGEICWNLNIPFSLFGFHGA